MFYDPWSRGQWGQICCLTSGITLDRDHIVWLQVNNLWSLLCLQYGNTGSIAVSLSQSLAQNLGIQWDPASKRSIHETHIVISHLVQVSQGGQFIQSQNHKVQVTQITPVVFRFSFSFIEEPVFVPLRKGSSFAQSHCGGMTSEVRTAESLPRLKTHITQPMLALKSHFFNKKTKLWATRVRESNRLQDSFFLWEFSTLYPILDNM